MQSLHVQQSSKALHCQRQLTLWALALGLSRTVQSGPVERPWRTGGGGGVGGAIHLVGGGGVPPLPPLLM